MPVASRPTIRACMVSVPKVWMAAGHGNAVVQQMPLPPGMASARRHRFAGIRHPEPRPSSGAASTDQRPAAPPVAQA